MLAIIKIILTIVGGVKLNQLYHKIFDITYFSLTAVITEWVCSLMLAGWIVSGIFSFLGFGG